MSYFWAEQNILFSVAIAIVLMLAVLEGVLTALGIGLSAMFDGLNIDAEIDLDADMDGVDAGDASSLGAILSWLRVGEVPFIVLLIIFLGAFGASGFAIQDFARELTGSYLPSTIAAVPAVFVALPIVRTLGGWIARWIPKEETSAVSMQTLIGRIATITLGSARDGHAAQAKVRDEHGQMHYVMVEPDDVESVFEQGSDVLLVRQEGAKFYAIANEHAALSPQT